MINRLRNRHRWMTPLFLGAVPAVVMIASVAHRPAAPVRGEIPAALSSAMPAAGTASDTIELGRPWRGLGWTVSQSRSDDLSWLLLSTDQAPDRAGFLLYWTPPESEFRATPRPVAPAASGGGGLQLPEGAILLGACGGGPAQSFRLPPATRNRDAILVLYSLTDREIVAVSRGVSIR